MKLKFQPTMKPGFQPFQSHARKKTIVKRPVPGISRFHFFPEIKPFPFVQQRREMHVRVSIKGDGVNILVRRWNKKSGELEKEFMQVKSIDEAIRQAIHTQFSILNEAEFNRKLLLSIDSNPEIKSIRAKNAAQQQISEAISKITELLQLQERIRQEQRVTARDNLVSALNFLRKNKQQAASAAINSAIFQLKKRNKTLLQIESPFFRDREWLLRGLKYWRFGRILNRRAIRELTESPELLKALEPNSTAEEKIFGTKVLQKIRTQLREISEKYFQQTKTELEKEKNRLKTVIENPSISETEKQNAQNYFNELPLRISKNLLIKPAPENISAAVVQLLEAEKSLKKGNAEKAKQSIETAKQKLLERNKELATILWQK